MGRVGAWLAADRHEGVSAAGAARPAAEQQEGVMSAAGAARPAAEQHEGET
jgi:hypothetical protein